MNKQKEIKTETETIKVDKPLNAEERKIESTKLLNTEKRLVYIVSPEKETKVIILGKLNDKKQQIPLCCEAQIKINKTVCYLSLGENWDKKHYNINRILYENYNIYKAENNNKEYTILTTEELDTGLITVYGNHIEIDDKIKFGTEAKIDTKTTLIITHSTQTDKIKLNSRDELINLCRQTKTNELLENQLFTHNEDGYAYRLPPEIEILHTAQILCTKINGYALNIIKIGIPGTGKSKQIESIHSAVNESQPIVYGENSTIKGITPSFKEKTPNPGAYARSQKIMVVDEFLRAFQNTPRENRKAEMGRMNSLLENKKQSCESGNGKIQIHPKARFLAVTNPIDGVKTMHELAEKIDTAFLSRNLIWYQTQNEIQNAQTEKGKQIPKTLIKKKEFITIIDYCQQIITTYDDREIRTVFDEIGQHIPNTETAIKNEIYNARYLHHARCLLDGIIKTRCIKDLNPTFCAIKEDYKMLEKLFTIMVNNWLYPTTSNNENTKETQAEEKTWQRH